MPVFFAFSVHHFISSVGADAGFAAIIGLAVLVLLYFAQARETASLREHSHAAAQRITQLEGRLIQLDHPQATPVPTPAPNPAAVRQRAGAARQVVPFPFAPAGVGAPALASATRLIPAAAPVEAVPELAPPDPVVPEPVAPRPAVPAARPVPSAMPAPVGAAPLPRPAPADATPGGNGTGEHASVPRPTTRIGGTTSAPPRVQIDPGGSGGGAAQRTPLLSPSDFGPDRSRSRAKVGRAVAALVTLLIAGAVVAVLLIVTSGGGGSKQGVSTSAGRTTNAPSARRPKKPVVFSPSTVTVTVLNGTATSGLAHQVAQQLSTAGYKQGMTPANAPEQTHTATIVAYMPGAANQHDAAEVAAALKLASSAVQPIDPNTQATACPQGQPCTANVVVTVGADLAPAQ